MSESDTLDLKLGRNSVNRSQHLHHVSQINKEQSAVMRIFQAEAARFRKQYMRYEPKPPSAAYEAQNVRMFETHTPGFCYRRNGDIRQTAVSHDAETEIFLENVGDLLFFDGEVNVERVMVLHLLSVQYVKREKRFRNVHSSHTDPRLVSSSISKSSAVGPYEIRRSILMPVLNSIIHLAREKIQTVKGKSKIFEKKQGNLFLKGSSRILLPSYLVLHKSSTENLDDLNDPFEETEHSDSQLSLVELTPNAEEAKCTVKYVRVYVHRPIHIIIDTVLDTLQDLNSNKVQQIIDLAKSPDAVREMLMKPEVQEFVDYLHGQSIMSRGDLFHVVPAKLVIRATKDSPPQFSARGEDMSTVNAIEITESSRSALKGLITDIKQNIATEERTREYKQSSDKSLVVSYSLSDVSIRPIVRSTISAFHRIHLSPKGTSSILTNTKVRTNESLVRSRPSIQLPRISKDAMSTDYTESGGEGFTISSYTGFRSKLDQSFASASTVDDLTKSSTTETLDKSSLPLKRKPIFNPKVTTHEVGFVKRGSKITSRTSKLISQFEMDLTNEMAKAKKSAPERFEKKVYSRKSAERVDSYHKFNRLRSPVEITAAKEDLKQCFLDQMNPYQRMLIFKKMNAIRERESYQRDEDIPFASYVVPILNKKAIMDIANKLSDKEKKKIFAPEKEGGLGLPQCYTKGVGALRVASASHSRLDNTLPVAEETVDTRSTEVDVSKLRCEIAEKETHKKFLRMMSQPVPI